MGVKPLTPADRRPDYTVFDLFIFVSVRERLDPRFRISHSYVFCQFTVVNFLRKNSLLDTPLTELCRLGVGGFWPKALHSAERLLQGGQSRILVWVIYYRLSASIRYF